MSRRKKPTVTRAASANAKPTQPTAEKAPAANASRQSSPRVAAAENRPPSIQRGPTRKQRRRRTWLLVGGALGLLLVGVLIWFGVSSSQSQEANLTIGGVTSCKKVPPFAQKHGFTSAAALDSQNRQRLGLVLYQPASDGSALANPPPYQHPTWSSAGSLSPPILDREGAVFVAPVPWINVLNNPVERSNTIFRVDPETAEMREFVSLPPAVEANHLNPYGILSLAYDCDSNSLYASSVYGSTPTEQHGRLFRVNLATKEVTVLMEQVDAFGIAIFNGSNGKRLYYSLARAPQVYSVALDASGRAVGDSRQEIDYTGVGYRGDERARRIIFTEAQMSVKLVAFDFTLAATVDPRETTLTYRYDQAEDRWIQ